jgi:hypothetical protein
MYKSRKLLAAVLIAVVMGSLVESCSAKLCCHKYETGSALSIYCNNHRDAVAKFIRSADTDAEQRERLSSFKKFYELIKECTTVGCIEDYIDSNTSLPGFKEFYETEHQFAEQETNIASGLKAKAILCGFKHAIDAFEKTLSHK